ncbi:hypothetical protein [Blastococcus tunisiensis]|uniref:Hemagglutinin n=1 Tax=Blastococcus tunisiensis TaxID=1798228 RepID=A0A1I1WHU6_9ACTN|nr:hypothetical protein [Blastococcus sp. DSM 46838]SFD94559.1 hypothetical protein SAMN05216574_101382 [Blastococcus sp. DSM 46838]
MSDRPLPRHLDPRRPAVVPRKRRSWLGRLLPALVVLAAAASVLTVGGSSSSGVQQAAELSQFDPGNIISDEVFFFGAGMSVPDIQAFIDTKGATCVTGNDGTPCLRVFRQNTTDRPSDAYCGGYAGAAQETAASIIAKVALSCGINPKVLLVMLEKERGLIRASGAALTSGDYRIAMGYGCPDTAPCDAQYYGFQNQVYMAAWQMQKYAKNPQNYAYKAGRTNNIYWHPNLACGAAPVYIQNQATAGLYNYTPYQPNSAALGNGGNTSCSSYGNRNFWMYFTDWFISTQSDSVAQASPRGNLEALTLTSAGFRAVGWSFDPDAAQTPVPLKILVDGTAVVSGKTGLPRPDVATVFGPGGANSGYSVEGHLSQGQHQVCVVADNAGGKGVPISLGCRTLDFTNVRPTVTIDVLAEQPDGSVKIGGWAFDGDGTPVELHVYDNGKGRSYSPTLARPDVYSMHAVAGPNAGYEIDLGPLSGTHNICVFGVDTVAPGNNTLLRCQTFSYKAPLGRVDAVTETAAGTLQISGWAFDPSVPTFSADTHVYVNGRGVAVRADQPRPDIARAFPGAGEAHGFAMEAPAVAGTNGVCVYSINFGMAGPHLPLVCSDFPFPYQPPLANVELITAAGPGQARVVGWAYDNSVPKAPVTMHYWVDGKPFQAANADLARTDITRFYPAGGPNHGFDSTLTLTPGRHTVCVFVINNGVPGPNQLMRCGDVTV